MQIDSQFAIIQTMISKGVNLNAKGNAIEHTTHFFK